MRTRLLDWLFSYHTECWKVLKKISHKKQKPIKIYNTRHMQSFSSVYVSCNLYSKRTFLWRYCMIRRISIFDEFIAIFLCSFPLSYHLRVISYGRLDQTILNYTKSVFIYHINFYICRLLFTLVLFVFLLRAMLQQPIFEFQVE